MIYGLVGLGIGGGWSSRDVAGGGQGLVRSMCGASRCHSIDMLAKTLAASFD